MGRRIHAILVTADGLECPALVYGDDLGRPPRVWEQYVPERVRLQPVGRDEYPTASKFIRRRYELDVSYGPGPGRTCRYVETSPHNYEKELADLRSKLARLEVDNGLLRQQVMRLGVVPTTGASTAAPS